MVRSSLTPRIVRLPDLRWRVVYKLRGKRKQRTFSTRRVARAFLGFARAMYSTFHRVSKADLEYLRGEPVPLMITIPVTIER